MKKLLLLVVFTATLIRVNAQQNDFTSFGRGTSTTFVTDYHTTGINPANLGFKRTYEGQHVTFGLFELGASAYCGALEKSEFRKSITQFGKTDFTYDQKKLAASQFANKTLAMNLEFNWLGFSYQNDKIGGFSFNVRETARWYSKFNSTLSDVAFMGFKAPYFDKLLLNDNTVVANNQSNYAHADAVGIKAGINSTSPMAFSKAFDGSRINLMQYREYALNYGKEVKLSDNFAFASGIGLKYLQGYAMMDIQAKDGKLTSFGSFSPVFNIDFGKAAAGNPSADTSGKYKPVGRGFGMDIGFNIYFKEKIKIGFAFTNIGSITWTGNVYSAKDQTLDSIGSNGFNSYNVFAEAGKFTGNGFFQWEGQKKMKTALPTTFRMGISHQLEDKGEVGIDVIVPMNDQPGSIKKPYWAIGGDFKVVKFIRLSGGIAYGGNFDKRVNIPLGLTFVIGEQAAWEIGFASRDAVTYFRQKGPALSFAMGFLRFRI